MSIDLFVCRESTPITSGESFAPTVHFLGVGRVTIGYSPAEEFSEEELAEFGDEPKPPYLVVSSRSGASPWIEFTAVEFAKRLGARIYGPQNGDYYEKLAAEHDMAALAKLHDEATA